MLFVWVKDLCLLCVKSTFWHQRKKRKPSNIGAFDYDEEYVIFEWMVVSCLIES